ncbi:MAG: hypothetical protein J0J06_13970 [Sphingomonas sp.]|uniref:hypothetical protein n=1 Tax=Sphingomonas sp. TaxID=28214 RepID=UPI001AC486ED|nr:hypothetical protein [Sphingomonas sp.]MBN8816542.1 hypothetical protein [Sphingomonas sp.]
MIRALLDADVRMLSAALIANEAIGRPHLITATGRSAPSRYAIVPPGIGARFALMPGVDFDDVTDERPGGGFVGGRLSRFAPFLDADASASIGPLQVTLRPIPMTRDAILRELRMSAGLAWAPGALYALVGWEDEWVAAWADRLREDGLEARLIIAHAQAMLALRKMWLAVVWNAPSRPVSGHLAATSGAVAVGRALIDVIAVIERLRRAARDDGGTTTYTDQAIARLVAGLQHVLRHLKAADNSNSPDTIGRKLRRTIKWAKILLDAVAVFSVGPEPLRQRWYRLNAALKKVTPSDHAGPLEPLLARIAADLEELGCANLGSRLQATGWRAHIRRTLHRLGEPDVAVRMARLDRVRGDLIYTLAITGRLERLYDLFPWLAAPHGAFSGCAGGALGALASLFECGRMMQLARDLKRRLNDAEAGCSTVARLTFSEMRVILASSTATFVAVDRGHAAGAELVRQGFSHATVQSALAGSIFGPHAALTHAQQARLGWNDAAAYRDCARTVTATEAVGDSLPFARRDHDDDVSRHMGMTVLRLINAGICSIFPTMALEPHRALAEDAARKAGRPRAFTIKPDEARVAMQDAMLASLDRDPAPDAPLHDGIADNAIPDDDRFHEVVRAQNLQSGPTRTSSAFDGHHVGQGRRRVAFNEPVNSDPRGELLRALIDETRRWSEPDKRSDRRAPCDDLLEDVLRGRAPHPLAQPVSDLFLPILWFAPYIDQPLLGWIGAGAPAARGWCGGHAAVSVEVGRAHAWAPSLYAYPFLHGRDDRIACHLFTGSSPITWDLGHAR